MKTVIVKVQRPLNDPSAPWMVYAENRMGMALVPVHRIPATVLATMTGEAKGYFYAELVGETWEIGSRAPAQDW